MTVRRIFLNEYQALQNLKTTMDKIRKKCKKCTGFIFTSFNVIPQSHNSASLANVSLSKVKGGEPQTFPLSFLYSLKPPPRH